MSRRLFHYTDARSHKFWAIELNGNAHTVHYGRIGSSGQTQTKTFASADQARVSHDRLIREKLAKGYVEVVEGASGPAPSGSPPGTPTSAAAEPSPEAWREALRCFDVEVEDALAFLRRQQNDLLMGFTEAVLDSPWGVATDWRDDQVEALEALGDALERVGVVLELDAEEEEQLEVTVQADGATAVHVRSMPEEMESFHDLVFALARILPPRVALYSLVEYEATDTYGHAVLPVERWQRLRDFLGPTFDRLFRQHRPEGAAFRRVRRRQAPSWEDFVCRTLRDRKEWMTQKATRRREQACQEMMAIIERRQDFPLWKKHWTSRNRKNRREFLESLQTPDRLLYTLSPLDILATMRQAEGAIRILDGDPGGWSELHAGLRTFSWYARLALWFFTRPDGGRKTGWTVYGNKGPHFLADALALSEPDLARWCGLQMLQHPECFEGGLPNPFRSFMPQLYTLWQGTEATATANLGVYRQVLDAWHDEGRLAQALGQVCDYHVRQAHRQGSTEFEDFPHTVFPSEVLAIRRVRQDLGLSTPNVHHPLLDTPLAHPPALLSTLPDDVLDRLISAVEEELPPL